MGDFHFRSKAHLAHLTVKECVKILQGQHASEISLLGRARSSEKCRDLIETVKIEFGNRNIEVPGLKTETRWSSTLDMPKKSYDCSYIWNGVTSRLAELQGSRLSEEWWETVHKMGAFRKSTASVTERQWGSLYVTLSFSTFPYSRLMNKYI